MADKIHKYLGLGVICYAYNIETSTYEIMFDLVPKEKFLESLCNLFKPHDV